jgi:hypothetical protein
MKDLRLLTATHRTELLLLGLTGVFDLSFGIEKLFVWLGRPLNPLALALFFLAIGAITLIAGVINLRQDIKCDCDDPVKLLYPTKPPTPTSWKGVDLGGATPRFITYAHSQSPNGPRFGQYETPPLPPWAVNVRPDQPGGAKSPVYDARVSAATVPSTSLKISNDQT